jgi:hypothetical protein
MELQPAASAADETMAERWVDALLYGPAELQVVLRWLQCRDDDDQSRTEQDATTAARERAVRRPSTLTLVAVVGRHGAQATHVAAAMAAAARRVDRRDRLWSGDSSAREPVAL